jgi:hypothetical protein
MALKSKSAKQAKQTPKSTTAQKQQPPPDWPALSPLIPVGSLTLETPLPNQILTISSLWTSTLCAKYVDFLRTLPLATTPGVPKKGDAVRVNDRFQIDDAGFAQRLWSETGLSEVVGGVEDKKIWGGEVLGLNPNIRIYRYSKGQFFDQHCEWLSPIFMRNSLHTDYLSRRRFKQYLLSLRLRTKWHTRQDDVDFASLSLIAGHRLQRW